MSVENDDVLALEAATNRRYLAALDRKAASMSWLTTGVTTNRAERFPFGPLIARVRTDGQYEDLGSAFYIGARGLLSEFDHPVVSWDARVAKIFFDPYTTAHELGGRVLVRRTLVARGNEIVRVFDSCEADAGERSPFADSELLIPPAPPARRRAAPTALPSPVEEAPSAGRSASELGTAAPRLRQGMRSTKAVEYALQAPRGDALTTVISTLQPDQYRLVTRSFTEPLILQGHPGTGKTIIAVHRAAYLVSEEREYESRGKSVKSLLLLGPTDEWVRHVRGVIRALDIDGRVAVRSLPSWLAEICGLRGALADTSESSAEDVGQFVKTVVDDAAAICAREQPWATGTGARMQNFERLYNVVRNGGANSSRLRLGIHSSEWIKTLPKFGAAVALRRYLPLFAQASLSICSERPASYGHVVVDEAQDVAGLEWEIIRAHNARGGWTIVGDVNQRRRFAGLSWKELAERLALRRGGLPIEPCVIERGYRSTQQILDFAKPLLPKPDRAVHSLQEGGPPPKVTRVAKLAERDSIAVSEAERLQAAYPNGTVAVIAAECDVVGLENVLRSSGWRRGEDPGHWRKEDRMLALRTADAARGVEFDAVVVVEPCALLSDLGYTGALYTSLTRANRELAVVHHRALPEALRRHIRQGHLAA